MLQLWYLINPLTSRPKGMPESRGTGGNIVNLTEISVMYGYVIDEWRW